MAPGWYGKLPALGDFASRRLPSGFVAAWDGWLQRGMIHSQERLGAAWLDSFLNAPVWRFVLGERTLDTQVWAGIVLPSVDRVGRYFPLTLCAALPGFNFSTEALLALERWMLVLEDGARSGLDPQVSLDVFEMRLADCPPPLFSVPQASVFGNALAHGDLFVSLEQQPGGHGLIGLVGDAALHATNTLFSSSSLWWCAGPDGTAGGFACHGMPSPAVFADMLQYVPEPA